jgi:hypothetical protein
MDKFANPIVWLTFLITGSVILLIGAAVIGMDRGVLNSMGRAEFARGLITYLFAITTIGVAVAVTLFALTESGSEAKDIRFDRAKDVLSLLLGVFGTIVGFYFGSESRSRTESQQLQVSSIDLTPQLLEPNGILTVRAVVSGGTPPYRFACVQGDEKVEPNEIVGLGGWIVKELQIKAVALGGSPYVRLQVQDTGGRRAEQTAAVKLAPAAVAPPAVA